MSSEDREYLREAGFAEHEIDEVAAGSPEYQERFLNAVWRDGERDLSA